MQNQNPDGHKSDEEKKQSSFNWIKNHKITTSLIAILYFSLNVIMNYFGNNPRLFYFPAIVACLAFCWIVLSGTHKFVMSQLLPSQSTNAPALNPTPAVNNLNTNVLPTVRGLITTPSPSAILDEIAAARPMQQDSIAKSFIGAKVRWLLYFNSVDTSRFGTIIVFRDGRDAKTINDILKRVIPGVVLCKGVSDEDKNLLRLAEKDSPFYVSGTISGCAAGVTLDNCKLEPYTVDTH